MFKIQGINTKEKYPITLPDNKAIIYKNKQITYIVISKK